MFIALSLLLYYKRLFLGIHGPIAKNLVCARRAALFSPPVVASPSAQRGRLTA